MARRCLITLMRMKLMAKYRKPTGQHMKMTAANSRMPVLRPSESAVNVHVCASVWYDRMHTYTSSRGHVVAKWSTRPGR